MVSSPEKQPPRRPRWRNLPFRALALCVIGLAVGSLYLTTSYSLNKAHAPPLDDTYIHFQYAKQLARGQFFRYHDGDSVSTGATSFLYPLLLAPFWKVGFRGQSLLWAAHFINLLGLFVAILSIWATLRRLIRDPWLVWLGTLLLLANGWFMWGIMAGMEVGVVTGCLALALWATLLFVQEDRVWPLAVALVLLAASRPEGLVMTGAVLGCLWLRCLIHQSGPPQSEARVGAGPWLMASARRLGRSFRRLPWPLWLTLVVALLPTIILAIASGNLRTNGMVVKSHWTDDVKWIDYLVKSSQTIVAVPGRILWGPTHFTGALLHLFAIAGLAGLIRRREDPSRRPWFGWVTTASVCAIILFYGLLMAHTEHHNRYYMPYAPLVVLLVVVGLDTLTRAFSAALRPALSRTAVVVLVVLGMGTLAGWSRTYAQNSGEILRQHVRMAHWMKRNLPRGSTVAICDAGAIPYLSERTCYDVNGLVTNDFRTPGGGVRAYGFIWENLERLKPGYMVIYPKWFADLTRLPIMERLHAARLHRPKMAGGKEKVAYRIHWERLSDPNRPWRLPEEQKHWRLVDRVDVACVRSESSHRYRVDHGDVGGRARFSLRRFSYKPKPGLVLDGGRNHRKGERFVIRNLTPGKPLLVGLRSSFRHPTKLSLEVGRHVRHWTVGNKQHRRDFEAYHVVPPQHVRARTLTVSVRILTGGAPQLSSYHYFFLQP